MRTRPGKRITRAVIASLATLAGGDAGAQTSPMLQVNREAGIAVSTLDQTYREFFPAGTPGRDRESGWAPGVAADVRWMGDLPGVKNLYGGVSMIYSSGRQDYRGSVFGSNTPLDFQSGLTRTQAQAELGKGIGLSPRLLITPGVRLGWSQWTRDLGPGQIETYRTFAAGAALHADYAITARLVLRGDVALSEEISPRITFDYGHNYDAQLGARPAYEGGLGLDYALTRRLHISADAALSRSGYGRSDVVRTLEQGAIFEPASVTTDGRLQAGLAYAF